MLSDGGSPPKGLCPAYPTMCIFIRKLHLAMDHSDSFSKFIAQNKTSAQQGGGGFTFGPFAFGGSAAHYSTSGSTQRDYVPLGRTQPGCSWDADRRLQVPCVAEEPQSIAGHQKLGLTAGRRRR